jgi:putative FmdB family regulatory protein
MPLYEYECEACKQRFEVIQKFSDPAPEACARCGKGPVHRQFSTPAIQFKGSGWYITDYAGGRSSAASSTSAGEGESKKDGDKKSPGEASAKSKSESNSSSSTSSTTSKESKE